MITFFLGTNAALSAGEIAAVLQRLGISFTVESITKHYLRITSENALPDNLIKILGGTIRITEDVATWNTMPYPETILESLSPLPPKWELGLGYIGMSLNIRKLGIELKKMARTKESKLSFIEPRGDFSSERGSSDHGKKQERTTSLLNAAQVIFNKLTTSPNAELIFIQEKDQVILTRTIAMQDISSYETRDTLRPARDAKVGLLPPKLAQIMINLGLPRTPKHSSIVYDPFCGMGTILQESWLMNIGSIGTDISERMVESAKENIEYLSKKFSVEADLHPEIFEHDATSPDFPEAVRNKYITIVSEPFLGTPLSRALSPAEAQDFYASVTPLYLKFFMNIKSVLKENSRLLVLLPAPRVRENGKDSFSPIPRTFLDEIAKVGYRKGQLIPKEISSFSHIGTEEPLLYARPDALIARELTLWERD